MTCAREYVRVIYLTFPLLYVFGFFDLYQSTWVGIVIKIVIVGVGQHFMSIPQTTYMDRSLE
jgi:cytochrome c biogenesis protein CcdA